MLGAQVVAGCWSKPWTNNQQRLETKKNQHNLRFLCLCRNLTRGVCIIHISTFHVSGGLTLFIHEPAHPNARAKGQKLFHFSFLKRKSGLVVNSNTLLSYQEDLSGLGCRTIVSHFHCSTSLWYSQITPITWTGNILSPIYILSRRNELLHVLCRRHLLRKRFLSIWYNTNSNFNDYTLIRTRRKGQTSVSGGEDQGALGQ